ncbi:hypothetical protein AOLI_G00035270 [Acnodon oligacanthus]
MRLVRRCLCLRAWLMLSLEHPFRPWRAGSGSCDLTDGERCSSQHPSATARLRETKKVMPSAKHGIERYKAPKHWALEQWNRVLYSDGAPSNTSGMGWSVP